VLHLILSQHSGQEMSFFMNFRFVECPALLEMAIDGKPIEKYGVSILCHELILDLARSSARSSQNAALLRASHRFAIMY
jgi:hypothetical protein